MTTQPKDKTKTIRVGDKKYTVTIQSDGVQKAGYVTDDTGKELGAWWTNKWSKIVYARRAGSGDTKEVTATTCVSKGVLATRLQRYIVTGEEG